MIERELCDLFWQTAASSGWPALERDELALRLAEAIARAAQAWPDVALEPARFVRYLAERFPPTPTPVATLAEHRLEELYLCCACVDGSRAALAELDRSYLTEAARALGNLDAQEALQRTREKLLTGSKDAPPKLAQYTGRGRLAGWIKVVLVRTALNHQREERRHAAQEDDVLAQRIATEARDPELEVIRAQYSETLAGTVAEAFQKLTSEQRNLLRLYVIDGLSLGELGRIHAVDPSTVSRWLGKIRGQLLEDAKALLLRRFPMRSSEWESLLRLVKSDLDVSIARLLGTGASAVSEPP